MYRYISFCLVSSLFLSACGNSHQPKEIIPSAPGRWEDPPAKEIPVLPFPKNVYLIDNGGCVTKDSLIIDSIGNGLFRDHQGNLFFKTYEDQREGHHPVLISRIFNSCEGDSTYDLKNNIDLKGFQDLGHGFYKDKNKVFYLNEMADGGTVGIITEADAKSFICIPSSWYAKDKKHLFYRSVLVEKADVHSFTGIYRKRDSGKDSVCYSGKDRRFYFTGKDICVKEEAYNDK
jgi:hypothetical protein